MVNYEADACIVGAGPSGALLGYLLAKKGLSVLLLEQHEELGKTFRGEFLNEEGEAVLKSHDLFQAVEALGLLRMEKIDYCKQGKIIKSIYPDPAVGHVGIHVPQAHLLKAIVNKVQEFPNFTCLLNTKVSELITDETGRYVGVVASKGGEAIRIRGHLLIGADGRYSTLRKQSHIEASKRKHGFDVLWAKIPAPKNWEPVIRMALIDGMQLSLFTQTNGLIQIGWNIEQGSYPTLRKQAFTPFILQLTKAFPELKDCVSQHIRSWQDFVVLDVFSSYSTSWGTDGLVLLGDAIHTMTPTGAFGLNSALKDADCLASLLTKETIKQFNVKTFQQMREHDIEEVLKKQIEKEKNFAVNFIEPAS